MGLRFPFEYGTCVFSGKRNDSAHYTIRKSPIKSPKFFPIPQVFNPPTWANWLLYSIQLNVFAMFGSWSYQWERFSTLVHPKAGLFCPLDLGLFNPWYESGLLSPFHEATRTLTHGTIRPITILYHSVHYTSRDYSGHYRRDYSVHDNAGLPLLYDIDISAHYTFPEHSVNDSMVTGLVL